MELLGDIRWIVAVAGILLVAASAVGGGLEIRELKIPQLDKWSRVFSGVIGTAFIILVFAFPIFDGPNGGKTQSKEDKPPISIEINSPTQGEELLPSRIVLGGTITSEILGSYRVDMIGQDEDGDCWFLKSMYLSTSNEQWKESLAPVLGPDWHGRPASILLVYEEPLSTLQPGDSVTCPGNLLASTSFFVRRPPQ